MVWLLHDYTASTKVACPLPQSVMRAAQELVKMGRGSIKSGLDLYEKVKVAAGSMEDKIATRHASRLRDHMFSAVGANETAF